MASRKAAYGSAICLGHQPEFWRTVVGARFLGADYIRAVTLGFLLVVSRIRWVCISLGALLTAVLSSFPRLKCFHSRTLCPEDFMPANAPRLDDGDHADDGGALWVCRRASVIVLLCAEQFLLLVSASLILCIRFPQSQITRASVGRAVCPSS